MQSNGIENGNQRGMGSKVSSHLSLNNLSMLAYFNMQFIFILIEKQDYNVLFFNQKIFKRFIVTLEQK